MINNPSLYVENILCTYHGTDISRTWCVNIIMQAVANALFCTIHITDSSSNPNATILTPVKLPQRQRLVFSGYINNKHYVSTLSTNKEVDSRKVIIAKQRRLIKLHKRKSLGLKSRQKLINHAQQMAQGCNTNSNCQKEDMQ